ncbi:hypothetical protein [Roseibium sp.]|uniref:hypothetical protein n=1 Tax=Roseibium sp. TaxID=1936156 RepID=UPI003A96CEBA
MATKTTWLVLAGLCLFLGGERTMAQSADSGSTGNGPAKDWSFIVAPYLLAPTITGSSRVGRLPATDIDVSPGTIFSNLHLGGMLHLEALYQDRFGAVFDVAYMSLGAATDTPLTGGRVRSKVDQVVLEGFLSYRAFNIPTTKIDLYTGGRYWDISIDLDATGTIAGNFDITRGDRWIDPVIGARLTHNFTEDLSGRLRGDIGGFGAGSDFTWSAVAGLDYSLSDTWSAHVMYKALGVDFDNGKSGTQGFGYDTITHGPLLGLSARF